MAPRLFLVETINFPLSWRVFSVVTVMMVSAYRLVNLGKEALQVWGLGPGRGSVV